MSLLEYALKTNQMDLAARLLVYGMMKAHIKLHEEKQRRAKRQSKRS